MGLGAPIWLLLLATIAVPWLVHRMRQHDLRIVELPTIALLRRALDVSARRRAIDDLLLLATRMALLATLAFALAAPFVWTTTPIATGAPLSVVIVIDDSMSMQRHGRGTLYSEATSRADRFIARLPRGSEVAVVAAGRPVRTLAPLGTTATARHAIAALPEHSVRGTDISAAIELATSHLAAAQHAERSIYVVTDLVGPGASQTPPIAGVPLRWDVVGSREAPPNLAVLDVRAEPDAEAPGAYRVHARIGATATGIIPVTVTVLANARIIASHPATITAPATDVELRIDAASVPGDRSVTIALDVRDALDGDNQRACLLDGISGTRVLLVDGDPMPAHTSDELHFLSRALPLAATSGMTLSVHAADVVSLADSDLDGFDLIWLANVTAPDTPTVARIRNAVTAGAALVISAGDNVRAAPYNAALSQLLPARIEGISDHPGIGLDAPDVGGTSSSSMSVVRTTRRLMTVANGNVLLRYADRMPALLQHSVGKGSVALWTTSIDADWTDIPYRPAFIALLAHLLRTSSVSASAPHLVHPGDSVLVRVATDAAAATLIDPAGVRSRIGLDTSPVAIDGSLTLTAGAYRLEVLDPNGQVRQLHRGRFVVAPPTDESDLTAHPVPPETPLDASGNAAANVTTQRARQSVDPWLYAAVAPWFAVEAVLRRRKRAPRLTRSAQA